MDQRQYSYLPTLCQHHAPVTTKCNNGRNAHKDVDSMNNFVCTQAAIIFVMHLGLCNTHGKCIYSENIT